MGRVVNVLLSFEICELTPVYLSLQVFHGIYYTVLDCILFLCYFKFKTVEFFNFVNNFDLKIKEFLCAIFM